MASHHNRDRLAVVMQAQDFSTPALRLEADVPVSNRVLPLWERRAREPVGPVELRTGNRSGDFSEGFQ